MNELYYPVNDFGPLMKGLVVGGLGKIGHGGRFRTVSDFLRDQCGGSRVVHLVGATLPC